MFVMGANSDLKSVGLCWEESRFSHYNICAEGALPHSITVKQRMVNLAY